MDFGVIFLPILFAWSTVRRFGGSPEIGLVLGLMLVAPQLPNAYAVGSGAGEPLIFNIFGLNLPVMGYQGLVIPALFVTMNLAKFQGKSYFLGYVGVDHLGQSLYQTMLRAGIDLSYASQSGNTTLAFVFWDEKGEVNFNFILKAIKIITCPLHLH